jgi:hypothetical protein
VARLEWAYQECLVAEELDPLDPVTLREVPADAYGTLRFSLRPACRLVHSQFPVLRIWEANQPDAASDEIIDLDFGPDFVLACRMSGRTYFRRIDKGDYQLLVAFAAGRTLDEALEASLALNPQFDLAAALRRCLECGVLSQMTFYQKPL